MPDERQDLERLMHGGIKPCHVKAFPELDISPPSNSPVLCLSLPALLAAVSGVCKEKQRARREPGGASSTGVEAVTLDLPSTAHEVQERAMQR